MSKFSVLHEGESHKRECFSNVFEGARLLHVRVLCTLTAVTVRPALVLPIPVVITERGITLAAYLRN